MLSAMCAISCSRAKALQFLREIEAFADITILRSLVPKLQLGHALGCEALLHRYAPSTKLELHSKQGASRAGAWAREQCA